MPAGELAAVKVGRDWYGRPADFEALIPQKKTLATVEADPLTAGADRILQEELGRRGLRLRKTAAPAPQLEGSRRAPRELASGPARPRALPPARSPARAPDRLSGNVEVLGIEALGRARNSRLP